MATALASSVTDLLLGLALASGDSDSGAGNRVAVDGLTLAPDPDGTLAIAIRRLEAATFEVRSGPMQWKVGHLAVHRATARVGSVAGKPHLLAFAADDAELSGVELRGPVAAGDRSVHGPSHFSLAPLAGAEGAIEAEIVDAHLVFDAQVKVPIRQGGIAFGDATVEHVGPDSRMGVSRMGIYVDAPNGRSYLFQFSSPPVAGVEYERRGAMLGPWVTDRGKLQLQPFAEWLLRQPAAAQGHGFTEQARLLFERTALSGAVQLGDGTLAVGGVRGEMAGRAQGHNAVRLQAEAVGRGVTLEMPSLSIRNAALDVGAAAVQCDAVAGALTLQLALEGKELRFALSLPNMKLSGLRLAPPRTSPP
jgi:hypothetical protein